MLRRTSSVIGALSPLLVLLSGCAGTQAMMRPFIQTQPEVAFKAKDYKDPAKIVGGQAEVYKLSQTVLDKDADLLAAYAPIIVQGVEGAANKSYEPDSDLIGQPLLKTVSTGGYAINIDTQSPTLFSSVEKVRVRDADLTQLVYVFWYPRHPVGLVEKGEIDGGVLRITLDAAQRPAIYEFVLACGCWHGLFVEDQVEAWAEKEFKSKEAGKKWFVEKTVQNEDDWKVRDIVLGHGEKVRPVLFLSAGRHECVAIQTENVVGGLDALPAKTFTLQSYSELDRLPVLGDSKQQFAPMFNPDGLVWGGRRKGEEKIFTKLDHGGWPRRLNAMKIHWDQEAFNDSSLLDKFMRTPHKLVEPDAVVSSLHR